MNIEKLIQITGYILRKYDCKKINYTKLIKILYLSDREAISEKDFSISGDSYVSMQNGPVLSELLDLIHNNLYDEKQDLWNSYFEIICDDKGPYDIKIKNNDISDEELSKFDKRILDETDSKYHNLTYSQMIEYTHTHCPEWKDPKIYGNGHYSIPLEFKDMLKAVGRSDDAIAETEADRCAFETESKCVAAALVS